LEILRVSEASIQRFTPWDSTGRILLRKSDPANGTWSAGKTIGGTTVTPPADSNGRALELRGGLIVFAGDSNTNYGIDYPVLSRQRHLGGIEFFTMARSKGRLRAGKNAGLNGDSSSGLLARFDADVIAQDPDTCHIMIGTNDAVGSIPVATYAANLTAIVAKCRAAGIMPVLSLVLPLGPTGDPRRLFVPAYNAWLKKFTANEGVPLIDTFGAVIDPATGSIRATLQSTGDNTHINALGCGAVAARIWAAIEALIPASVSHLSADATDPVDLLAGQGLFLAAGSTAGLGAGWTKTVGTVTTSFEDTTLIPGAVAGSHHRRIGRHRSAGNR
jgi:lysophospholipase L1-like esterase